MTTAQVLGSDLLEELTRVYNKNLAIRAFVVIFTDKRPVFDSLLNVADAYKVKKSLTDSGVPESNVVIVNTMRELELLEGDEE